MGEQRGRPFLNALAGAGFASLAVMTGAGDLYAHSQPEGVFSSLAGDTPAGSTSISSSETNSPDLGVFGMHVTNYLGFDLDNAVNMARPLIFAGDLRDDSPTFGEGVDPQDLKNGGILRKGSFAVVQPLSQLTDAAFQGADREATTRNKDYACFVMVGGTQLTGSVNEKLAAFGGMTGFPAEVKSKVPTVMSDYEFDAFVLFHEIAHCLDKMMVDRRYFGTTGAAKDYWTYMKENRADAFSLIMLAKDTRNPGRMTLERIADISQNIADARMTASLISGSSADPFAVAMDRSLSATTHFTTSTGDATAQWIRETGINKIRKMSEDEIFEQAKRISAENTMSFADFNLYREKITDIRRGNSGELILPPSLLDRFPDLHTRATTAMYRMNMDARSLRITSMYEGSQPDWMSKKAYPETERQVAGLAENELKADIEAGASIVDVRSRGVHITAILEEASGEETTVKISKDRITRINSEGLVHSFSESRPGSLVDGNALHFQEGISTGSEYKEMNVRKIATDQEILDYSATAR